MIAAGAGDITNTRNLVVFVQHTLLLLQVSMQGETDWYSFANRLEEGREMGDLSCDQCTLAREHMLKRECRWRLIHEERVVIRKVAPSQKLHYKYLK